jgi:hypothetical protein
MDATTTTMLLMFVLEPNEVNSCRPMEGLWRSLQLKKVRGIYSGMFRGCRDIDASLIALPDFTSQEKHKHQISQYQKPLDDAEKLFLSFIIHQKQSLWAETHENTQEPNTQNSEKC